MKEVKKSTRRRWYFPSLLLLLAAFPVVRYGADRAIDNMYNAPVQWIPSTFGEREQYQDFEDRFEGNDLIIVSWPGATYDDPRLSQLARWLEAFSDPAAPENRELITELVVDGTAPDSERELMRMLDEDPQLIADLFSQKRDSPVLTGPGVIEQIAAEVPGVTREEAARRLQGTLVGVDGRTSAAIVLLGRFGDENRQLAIDAILDVAEELPGLDRNQFVLAGPPVDAAVIDEQAAYSMDRFVIPSAVVTLFLCWFCLRSWWLTFNILVAGAFGNMFALAMVWVTGAQMNAILIAMPPLVFVLTVSGGIHLVNYFYDEVNHGDDGSAVGRAIRKGWAPCALAAFTTAVGMASLLISDVTPVRNFGLFSAVSVLTTTSVLLILLPGAMSFDVAQRAAERSRQAMTERLDLPSLWDNYARFLVRFAPWIVAGCVVLMLGLGMGLRHIRTSVNIRALFTEESRIVNDYAWLEEHLGPLVPVEVVVKFGPKSELEPYEELQVVQEVARQLDEMKNVDGIMSAATFAPAIPQGGGYRQVQRRAAIMASLLPNMEERNYFHEEKGVRSWRVSARVYALAGIDYGDFLDRLEDKVEPILDYARAPGAFRQQGVTGLSAAYTGVMPLAYNVQHQLLQDLIESFMTAFVLVTGIMVFVLLFGHRRALSSYAAGGAGAVVGFVLVYGFLAAISTMGPNLFPATVLFGGLGWLRTPVDIGTVMTASIALGIAVDDTLHFLWWFRRDAATGVPRPVAVRNACRHCGRAMIQTTIICGLGLSVFALSQFVPTKRFAYMLMFLLFTALVGDLLLLPAMLLGPVGRLFQPKAARQSLPAPQTAPAHISK